MIKVAVNEVARVYASSLAEIGQEKNILNQLEEEMKFVTELLKEDRELNQFFTSPGFSKDSKKDFISKVFSGKLSESVVNLLNLLVENDRQAIVGDIYLALNKLIDEANNRKEVTIVSCEKLDESSIDNIKAKLKDKLNKDIVINEEIDKSILGGIIIKIDDLVIDGSLSKGLKNIRKNLLNSKVRSEVAYED